MSADENNIIRQNIRLRAESYKIIIEVRRVTEELKALIKQIERDLNKSKRRADEPLKIETRFDFERNPPRRRRENLLTVPLKGKDRS